MSSLPLNYVDFSCGGYECKAPIKVYQARQCSFCGGKAANSEDPYYHITCKVDGCMRLNCEEHGTCWENHLPRSDHEAKRHVPLDPFPQLFADAVTHSEKRTEVLEEHHSENAFARWFKIKRDEHDRPDLYVYDRFNHLCDPERTGNRATTDLYPSFVSFVGDTSQGKSTILRAMLLMGHVNASGIRESSQHMPDETRVDRLLRILNEERYGPVTRSGRTEHLKDPTTLGVCLYSDDGGVQRPTRGQNILTTRFQMLFADCEGFNAGNGWTNAERMEVDAVNPWDMKRGRLLSPPGKDGGRRSRSTSRANKDFKLISKDPVTANCYSAHGKDGVDLFYARYLYAISDVVVFVTKEDQKMDVELTRVLEWASTAVYNSVNHPSRKTLIIARNMSEHHDEGLYDQQALEQIYLENDSLLWKDSARLRDFVDKYNASESRFTHRIRSNDDLYKALFHKIICCYIPHARNVKGTGQLFDQFAKLRFQIESAAKVGLTLRAKGFMQYNVPALSRILRRAFEHFRGSEEPFDFYDAARLENPNPASLSEHLANFIRHAYGDFHGARKKLDNMVLESIAIALVVYARRNFETTPSPDEVFRRLSDVCLEGIKMYQERYQRCTFVFNSGQQCIVRPLDHWRHAAKNGDIKGGDFCGDAHWDDGNKKNWISRLERLFADIFARLNLKNDVILQGEDLSSSIRNGRKEITRKYADIWIKLKSNQSCLSCLQGVPDHVMACTHAYCPQCVQELGKESPGYESAWVVEYCFLCWEDFQNKPHLIRLKPRCAGVRLLTLDGGGIRGIVELSLLVAIRDELDLRIPLRDLFDLIVGTSTGGIIALALAMSEAPAIHKELERMVDFFKEASSATFKKSRAGRVFAKIDPSHLTAKLFMLLRAFESIFESEPLKHALVTYFGEDTVLFAPGLRKQYQGSTRVAVTAAKDNGETDTLIASYNRPSFEHASKDFEREDCMENEMKIWESALATSAAPFWLPAFRKSETQTEYIDGAVYANCPASAAYQEMAKLWPDDGASLDILLSLGTGLQERNPDSIPAPVKFGGFVAMRAMFDRQVNSTKNWDKFKKGITRTQINCRLKRLNPQIQGKYVALHEYDKIPDLQDVVAEWATGIAGKEIKAVAQMLLASLFYFEPNTCACSVHGNEVGNPEYEWLCGTIRCRLAHESHALDTVLKERADSFWHVEVQSADTSSLAELRPERWQKLSVPSGGLATELVQDTQHGRSKFRLRHCFRVRRHCAENQVLALKLQGKLNLIPISGFPATLGELNLRASKKWLQ